VFPAGAAALVLDEVLTRVAEAERGIRDLAVSFRQETLLKATGDRQEITGELLALRSPERFRVSYTSPVRQVAVYDGKVLVLHFPETGQAFRQRADARDLTRMVGVNPLAPLEIVRRGSSARLAGCDRGSCRLEFSRGGKTPVSWTVRVSSTTWLLEEASFASAEIRLTVACSDYRVNRGLSASVFSASLPPGTDVQEGLPDLLGTPGGGLP
jgi:outer membrane lipoprotein-sorting protein